METAWQHLTAAQLNERAAAGAVVLLPVASTEQHGPHMATGVDCVLVAEVCNRAASRLTDLGHSIREAGFRRLVVVNGHGGNMTALNAMSAELSRDLALDLRITTYFQLAEAAIAPLLEDQPGVLHACEAETSMMLAVRPDLVDETRLAQAHGPMAARAGAALNAPLHRWRSFADITATGVLGDALSATPEKGERLLEAAADALALALAQDDPPTPPES